MTKIDKPKCSPKLETKDELYWFSDQLSDTNPDIIPIKPHIEIKQFLESPENNDCIVKKLEELLPLKKVS